jgi:hypothetical protein
MASLTVSDCTLKAPTILESRKTRQHHTEERYFTHRYQSSGPADHKPQVFCGRPALRRRGRRRIESYLENCQIIRDSHTQVAAVILEKYHL